MTCPHCQKRFDTPRALSIHIRHRHEHYPVDKAWQAEKARKVTQRRGKAAKKK